MECPSRLGSARITFMETAFANLPSDPAALRAIILTQAAELAAREAELRFHGTLIERLKAQLAALRRARFGTSSEKLDRIADQLELALEEIEARNVFRRVQIYETKSYG